MKLPGGRRADSERVLYALIAGVALIVIYLVAFVLSNTRRVKVSFVVFDGTASLIWVMLLSALLGLVIGIALTHLWLHSRVGRRGGAAGTGRRASGATAAAPTEPIDPR